MIVEELFKLPWEVLLRICSFLDPDSLNNFALSSPRYKVLLDDDLAWRAAFLQHYKRQHFTPVADSWIQEYKVRNSLLRKYHRNRGRNLLFDAKIGNISVLEHDPATDRIICGNKSNGLVALASSSTGRVAKDLIYPARNERITSSDICVMLPARSCIAYGFRNGRIAVNVLTKPAVKAEFHLLRGFHTASITCISSVSGLHIQGQSMQLVTGSLDGQIKFWSWDHALRDCHGSFDLSEAVLALYWLDRKAILLVLLATRLVQIKYDQGIGFVSTVLGEWSMTHSATQMFVDLFASIAVVAIGPKLIRFRFAADGGEETAVLHESECDLAILVTDELDDVKTDSTRPGAGSRLCAFSSGTAQCTISLLNCRTNNLPAATKQIVVPMPITALALNAVVLVSGHIDGSVLVHDVLESGQLLRQISSRIAKFDRIALEDPLRTYVSCIKLGPQSRPAGVIAIGGQVRAFDFEPKTGATNGKRKEFGKKRHIGPRHSAMVGGAYSQQDIHNELMDMESGRQFTREDEGRLKKYGGTLSCELQESELLSYVSLLSMEDARTNAVHPDTVPHFDADLAEAIKRSLLPSNDTTADEDTVHGNRESLPDEALPFDEAYELTLALSQSMAS